MLLFEYWLFTLVHLGMNMCEYRWQTILVDKMGILDTTYRLEIYAKARHTPCDFRLMLDAETTKRRSSHGVCAPKTFVVR